MATNDLGGGIPRKPPRPFTAYHIFYQLERNYIIQTTGDVSASAIDSEFDEIDTNYSDRPPKYRATVLPKDWHTKGSRQKSRSLRKNHGKISFMGMTKLVSQRWKEADGEIKRYCRSMAERELKRYREEMDEYTKRHGAWASKNTEKDHGKRRSDDEVRGNQQTQGPIQLMREAFQMHYNYNGIEQPLMPLSVASSFQFSQRTHGQIMNTYSLQPDERMRQVEVNTLQSQMINLSSYPSNQPQDCIMQKVTHAQEQRRQCNLSQKHNAQRNVVVNRVCDEFPKPQAVSDYVSWKHSYPCNAVSKRKFTSQLSPLYEGEEGKYQDSCSSDGYMANRYDLCNSETKVPPPSWNKVVDLEGSLNDGSANRANTSIKNQEEFMDDGESSKAEQEEANDFEPLLPFKTEPDLSLSANHFVNLFQRLCESSDDEDGSTPEG